MLETMGWSVPEFGPGRRLAPVAPMSMPLGVAVQFWHFLPQTSALPGTNGIDRSINPVCRVPVPVTRPRSGYDRDVFAATARRGIVQQGGVVHLR
jgi:hypothetical protein